MQRGVSSPSTPAAMARLDGIARARRALLHDGASAGGGLIAPWIARSWQRCLAMGHLPRQAVAFDSLPSAAMRRARDANQALTRAASATLQGLGRALADTRYFAILTNADGVVVDTSGPIDRSDRRADLITRVGVDLSERSVGTTAIGSVLSERQPVWLHRGEHFFNDTSVYSCAGAPLFGPTGRCVGMLDLTGIDVPERPELMHLVVQAARGIENAMALCQAHAVLLRLNWPGTALGGDSDALIGIDDDGCITTCNQVARALLPQLGDPARHSPAPPHVSELFAMPFEMLFDAAHPNAGSIDIPLWSGLRLHVLASFAGRPSRARAVAPPCTAGPAVQRRLRDIETALIREAVEATGGNVARAALQLGVSRATVYRKLRMRTV